ncbi:hypothetical protein L3X38_014127 [Prunus dulcis]|uniref:Cyclic nucleotide-binding domain-containing protein n=2 Tax=Prunus dulcis TaxID=3755 RepID=A0AAD4WMK0_PRUDU|nr:hypothetical protein L3X38_014127 [Prunus dulcis]
MEEKAEATVVADNWKEKAARRWNFLCVLPSSSYDPNLNAARLNNIFISSCVLGVLLDPLFLYIPMLNQDIKCMKLDNTLMIAALVSRSFTDLFYIGRIIFQACRIILQVCRFKNCPAFMNLFLPESSSSELNQLRNEYLPKSSIAKKIWQSSIIVDILAILPLPQVVILFFFLKMKGGSFGKHIMNTLIMVQYVPRVLRIYLSCKKAKKPFKGHMALWVKGLLNFFLYILASHVLGAFWYFFAVQRLISCWEHACRYENGCGSSTFDCHDHHTLRNITVLNDLCPINPQNSTLFDFGIYLNILQSGVLWSTNYPLKYLNSFCWGLRNLSSLASNLQPSFNTWEILFVAFISIIGLLLFVYLIGNLQTYVQLDTERLESHRRKMKIEMKMKVKGQEVESWLSKNGIPLHNMRVIMEKVRQELEENWDIDVVQEILSVLTPKYIKSCTPFRRLQKVPLLKDMDEGVLREISEKLKPKKYTPEQIIIEKDQTLEMMLFIVDGRVTIEKENSQLQLGAGDLYGEELLVSPLWTSSGDAKPINESVRAIDDVQALVISATDMATLGFSSRRSINELRMVVTILQKVPKLQTMDKQVLKAMSHHLSVVSYKRDDYIVRENQPVSMMFFVTRGEVTKNENPLEENFIGEELLEWVLDKSFPTILPLSTCTVRVVSNDAEVLILKARILKSVVSKFMKHFSDFASPSDIRLTWLKKVQIFQNMEEQVLEAILQCLKPMNFNVAKRHILQEKKPLKIMFFVIRGVVLIENDSAMDVNIKKTCEIGSFYGEELVHWVTTWVSHKSLPPKLPLSPCSALCGVLGGPVEILALKADDLKSVVSEFRSKFSMETALPTDSDQPRDPLTILKNVESLEAMDEEVLKEICKHLTQKTYKDEYIILKDKQMEMMFFIVSGVVSVTNESSKHYRREGERPNHSGDELIQHWMRSKSTEANVPAELPPSPFSFWAIGEVEVQILKAEDLARVQLGDRIG